MKPNFALSLSFEGIRLLWRDNQAWKLIDHVGLDAQSLIGELAALRGKAQVFETGDVTCKIVLPNDQIKFTKLDVANADENTVRAALEGATPYALDELVFDWVSQNGTTYIAAVARETLAEAEGFATEHRFNPVSFVAAAAPEDFPVEVVFGPSHAALAAGARLGSIERDDTLVVESGIAVAPVARVAAEPPSVDEMPDEHPDADVAETVLTEDVQQTVDDTAQDVEPTASDATSAQTDETSAPENTEAADSGTPKPETSDVAAEKQEDVAKPSDPVSTPDDTVVVATEETVDVPEPATEAQSETPDPAPEEDTPTVPMFGTRRTGSEPPAPEAKSADETTGLPVEPALSAPVVATETDANTAAAPSLGGVKRDGTEPPNAPTLNAPVVDDVATPDVPATPVTGQAETALTEEDAAELASGLTATVAPDPTDAPPNNPTGMFLSRRNSRKTKTEKVKVKSKKRLTPQEERAQMTIFGARKKAKKEVGGKPKFLGLILTAILLLFMAGVAVWASFFTDDGLAGLFKRADTSTAVAEIAPAGLPSEALANGVNLHDPDNLTQASLALPSQEELLDASREDIPLEAPVPEIDEDLETATRFYAATGIWQLPPTEPDLPLRDDLDTLYVATVDAKVKVTDAVALPALRTVLSDFDMSELATPVALNTVFQRDARGLILATAEGAVSPNGFTVFAGKPPKVAPLRPDGLGPDVIALADERLKGFRPKPRPESLVEKNERETLGGLSRSELAAIRPKTRTNNIQIAAVAAAAAREAEASAVAAAAEKAALEAAAIAQAEADANADPTASATRLAVANSRQPQTRPRNFDRTVKQARANAAKAAKAASSGNVVAAVAPRTTKPSGPTATTVARQATQTNAINLRRINLLGVSGTPSARKAIVRLKNGRLVTVQKGDRLDGGRVTSISETALRYTKNGRNIVLEIG